MTRAEREAAVRAVLSDLAAGKPVSPERAAALLKPTSGICRSCPLLPAARDAEIGLRRFADAAHTLAQDKP
jgi:hypothetical protein